MIIAAAELLLFVEAAVALPLACRGESSLLSSYSRVGLDESSYELGR